MLRDPKTEAVAFRIWQYAKPQGWNVTISDIASALDLNRRRVRATLAIKGWSTRVRASLPAENDLREDFRSVVDNGLDDLARQTTV
jgi:hypothetical protein